MQSDKYFVCENGYAVCVCTTPTWEYWSRIADFSWWNSGDKLGQQPKRDDALKHARVFADAMNRRVSAKTAQPPAGMVLVPREPTPEILQAGIDANDMRHAARLSLREDFAVVYKAMLAAAPPAAAETRNEGEGA